MLLQTLLFLVYGVIRCATSESQDWYEYATFYEFHPVNISSRNAVIKNLEYLKNLEITATWISPPFVKSFYNFPTEYGTLHDFEYFLNESHRIGIKVLLDFIPNHTSDQHEWFLKSENEEKEYKDYYIWHPGTGDIGFKESPNNWRSLYDDYAWTFNEKRHMYYLHQFKPNEPDLNYRNPLVRKEMENILRFWIKKGVDGFLLRDVNHLFEDIEFRNEPRSSLGSIFSYQGFRHIYTKDMPEDYELIYDWRKLMDEYKKIMMLDVDPENYGLALKYYQDEEGERVGAHIPLNFALIQGYINEFDATSLKDSIDFWLEETPKMRTPNWVMGFQDKSAVTSHYGDFCIDLLNTLVMTLPGVSVIYNGEELGNRVYARNYGGENVPVNGHYLHFTTLSKLRKFNTFKFGNITIKDIDKDILAYTRSLQKADTYVITINKNNNLRHANLSGSFSNLPENMTVVAAGLKSNYKIGNEVQIHSLTLNGYDAIVIKTSSAPTLTSSFLLLMFLCYHTLYF